MPRTPEQYEKIRNKKKKVILDAALELFANKGYALTSISQIAEKANISKGLMYNYFESKEELLKTIIINLIDELVEYLDSDGDNKTSEDEALRFVDKYFEFMMNRTEELKLFTQFSVQPEVVQYLTSEVIVEKGKRQQELLSVFFSERHQENIQLVLLNFSAILKGIAVKYVFTPEMYPEEVMIGYREYIKDMFIRKIKK